MHTLCSCVYTAHITCSNCLCTCVCMYVNSPISIMIQTSLASSKKLKRFNKHKVRITIFLIGLNTPYWLHAIYTCLPLHMMCNFLCYFYTLILVVFRRGDVCFPPTVRDMYIPAMPATFPLMPALAPTPSLSNP